MAPRGSGLPDLSQRPRREAPGMLTALAILERDLGAASYDRHVAQLRLDAAHDAEGRRRLKAEIGALDARIAQIVERLAQEHETWQERQALRTATVEGKPGPA